jgi:lipopolysaccharide transport system permease protein
MRYITLAGEYDPLETSGEALLTTVSTNQSTPETNPDSGDVDREPSQSLSDSNPISRRFECVIEPVNVSIFARVREAYVWRDLLFMLVQRDIKVRYRQTIFGIVWAVMIPLMTLGVYWVVFEKLIHRGTANGLPYPIFLFPALIIWNYYSSSVGRAANALKQDSAILSKVYFPRLLLPMSSITSPIVDFCFGLLILVVILVIYQHPPGFSVVMLPAFLLLAIISAAGMGMGLSVLNSHFRDVQHFLPVMLQLWFFCSPILYSTGDLVPERFQLLYAVNPMVTVCEGARSCLLNQPMQISIQMALVSCVSAVVLLVVGLITFMRLEQNVTDVI